MSPTLRLARLLAIAPIVYALYFFAIARSGLVGPDEPRYASIGREMARSGDWITPRLWGEPWFEKPALLYWTTAIAFRVGLDEDVAPRLPVAIIGVGFLAFFHWLLRREFGSRPALYSTIVLGTSAGWLGLSHVAIPDVPMAAFFSAAMLLGMVYLRTGAMSWGYAAAASLGLAVLTKGLLPLALAIPLIWQGRKRFLLFFQPGVIAVFLAVAAPWYVLCYLRNGMPFLRTFFWEHHLGRFVSGDLQHVQPFWFYSRILVVALFPWTVAASLLFRRSLYSDSRHAFLLLWFLFGLIFFSVSANKLPGYILPLLPAAAALIGIALAGLKAARWILASAAVLLCLIFPFGSLLPKAIESGLSRAQIQPFHVAWLLPILLVPVVWRLDRQRRRPAVMTILAGAITLSIVYLKMSIFPAMDRQASARPLWHQISGQRAAVCVEDIARSWRYGLNYYAVIPLPDCNEKSLPLHVTQLSGEPPKLEPVK